jgi:DNA-binding transcriptional LysR family regulator
LNRTTRRLDLTDVGAAFYDRCVQILADIDEAERAVTQLQTEARGKLRVSAPMSFGLEYVAPVVASLLEEYDDLEIDIDYADRRVDLLAEGFDVAVRVGSLQDSSFMARKLADTHRFICASPEFIERNGAPASIRDIADNDFLLYSYSTSGDSLKLVDGDREIRVPLHGRLRANNGDALLAAAIRGVGMGVFPDFLAAPHMKAGLLVPIVRDWQGWHTAIWAVYPHNRHLSAKVRTFVDALSDALSPVPWEDMWDCETLL